MAVNDIPAIEKSNEYDLTSKTLKCSLGIDLVYRNNSIDRKTIITTFVYIVTMNYLWYGFQFSMLFLDTFFLTSVLIIDDV